MKKLLVILVIFILVASKPTEAQWDVCKDVRRASPVKFSSNDKCIFACVNSGLAISTNSGLTWVMIYASDFEFVRMAYSDKDTIFALVDNKIVYTSDYGTKWKTRFDINDSITSVTSIDYKDGKFAIGTSDNGVFIGLNNGWNWLSAGLKNQKVTALALSGDSILAGTHDGLYASINFGASWEKIGFDKKLIRNIFQFDSVTVIHADSIFFVSEIFGSTWSEINNNYPKILRINKINSHYFICTEKGLYTTTNLVRTWDYIGPDRRPGLSITKIGDLLFYGTLDGFGFKSTDLGASWLPVDIPFKEQSILSLSLIGKNLFVGSISKGYYVSKDGGKSFFQQHGMLDTMGSYCFVENGSDLYTGTKLHGLLKSSDYGENWQKTGPKESDVLSILVKNNSILLTTFHGVYKSTDNGVSWNKNDDFRISEPRCFFEQGDDIYLGTVNRGVFLSTNMGDSWSERTKGLYFSPIISFTSIGQTIYVSSLNNGIFKTTNKGNEWTLVSKNLYGNEIRNICTYQDMLFAAWPMGLYFTSDNGYSWNATDSRKWATCAINLDSTLFLGVPYGLYKIENINKRWISNNIDSARITSFCSNGNFIAASVWDGHVFLRTKEKNQWIKTKNTDLPKTYSLTSFDNSIFAGTFLSGIYRSDDYGESWIEVNNGLENYDNRCLLTKGDKIFAGTWGNGVFISKNKGNNWEKTILDNEYITCLEGDNNSVYAGTLSSGLYKSTDNGSSWINLGLMNKLINTIAVDSNYIYVGTNKGLFFSNDYGANWYNSYTMNQTVNSIFCYKNLIFAGTNSGVYYCSNNNNIWSKINFMLKNLNVNALSVFNDSLFAGTNGAGIFSMALDKFIFNQTADNNNKDNILDVQISPNPASDYIEISLDNHTLKGVVEDIRIYDLLGIEQSTPKDLTPGPSPRGEGRIRIDVSHFSPGVYFVRAGDVVRKFVKF